MTYIGKYSQMPTTDLLPMLHRRKVTMRGIRATFIQHWNYSSDNNRRYQLRQLAIAFLELDDFNVQA